MIDEDRLRQLLRAGAESYEPSESARRAVLRIGEHASPPPPRGPRWRRPLVPVAAGLLLVAVVAALVTGTYDHRADEMSAQRSPDRAGPVRAAPSSDSTATGDASGGAGGDAGLDPSASSARSGQSTSQSSSTNYGSAGNAGGRGDASGGRSSVATAPVGPPDAKVVKSGSMELEIPEGQVGSVASRLSALAAGVNGFVADSRTLEGAEEPSGTVTLRVPAAAYEGLLQEVRRLGEVMSATSRGQDVTDQYTDLDARIRAHEATRAQYLALLGRAQSIQEILTVQNQVNQVQVQLEQLQGQRAALDDQASFATLAVTFTEPGDRRQDEPRSGMAKAWEKAVSGFVGGVEAIVAASGAVLVWFLGLSAVALGGTALWTVARRRLLWVRAGETPPSG